MRLKRLQRRETRTAGYVLHGFSINLAVVLLSAWLWTASTAAQTASVDSTELKKACSEAEFRQFDFWVGDWDLRSRMLIDPAQDLWEESSASNRVQVALDSCVIIEEFDGNPASDLRGMSVSTYNARLGLWQQTWVDNSGGYLDFSGGLQPDGRMILGREVERDGHLTQQRMVFSNITQDSLDWSWERSTDSGRSWRPLWLLHYTRRP